MVQLTYSYHLKLCSNIDCYWRQVIRCLFSLQIDCRLYLIPFVMFPWLSVILEPGLGLICRIVSFLSHKIILRFDWLRIYNPHFDWWVCNLSVKIPGGHYFLAGLPCDSISHAELAFLDSICKNIDCRFSFLVHVYSSGWVSWCHGGMWYFLLVGSLGTSRLTIGMICVLSLLMYLTHYQHHKSITLSTGLNSCQAISHQVNGNIGCHHQSWPKCIDNLTSIWV